MDKAGFLNCPGAEHALHWMLGKGRLCGELPDFLVGLTGALTDGGFPLFRLYLGSRMLHPQIAALSYYWSQGDTMVQITPRGHDILESDLYQNSPVRHLYETDQKHIRRRLHGPEAKIDFPILAEVRDQGATDYAIFALDYSSGQRSALSIATDRPAGFLETEIEAFQILVPVIATIIEAREMRRMARSLLRVYLGDDPGRRVLGGLIQRGESITLAAAIWYCDLRDFTAMSNALPRDIMVETLNTYFDIMASPVLAHGGQILKFIGDAMLAIFPMHDDMERDIKIRTALTAAEEALDDLATLNMMRIPAGLPPLRAGIGLNAGTIAYGNIGAAERLDFTAIGPAVNLAVRLQSLCPPLGRSLLASDSFAATCGSSLVPLGSHALHGFDQPQDVFGLPPHKKIR